MQPPKGRPNLPKSMIKKQGIEKCDATKFNCIYKPVSNINCFKQEIV